MILFLIDQFQWIYGIIVKLGERRTVDLRMPYLDCK